MQFYSMSSIDGPKVKPLLLQGKKNLQISAEDVSSLTNKISLAPSPTQKWGKTPWELTTMRVVALSLILAKSSNNSKSFALCRDSSYSPSVAYPLPSVEDVVFLVGNSRPVVKIFNHSFCLNLVDESFVTLNSFFFMTLSL